MNVEVQIVNAFVDNGEGGNLLIEQGRLMAPPSPSIIHVRLSSSGGRIDKLMAGGKAKLVATKLITL